MMSLISCTTEDADAISLSRSSVSSALMIAETLVTPNKCILHHWDDDESCVQILSRCGRRWFLAAGSPSSS